MDWLKIKWTLLGIDAPRFIWIVAALLIGSTIYFLFRLGRKISSYQREFAQTTEKLQLLDKPAIGAGIDSKTAERLRQDFASQPTMGTAWHQFETSLITQNDVAGSPQWWRTSSANAAFSEDNLTTEKLNKNAYQATPSIITGVGLLTTFAAILVALLDVRVIDGGKVIGLELLIQGLSGKFISSVVALLCATAFIFLEKRWFYSLEKSRQQLVNALDRLFPQLSSVQMLVNVQNGMLHWQSQLMSGIGHVQSGISHFQTQLVSNLNNFQIKLMESVDNLQANTKSQNSLQKQLVENLDKFQIQLISNVSALKDNIENQTVCIQDFNTSLAPMLQQTFDESMTPTMNRMVKAIEDMNELLRASEANKSDSISETIEQLLKVLQDSMTRSIDQMGNAFSKSLSGSAQEQFEKIATTLSGTATMLDAMNTQFAGTQNDMRQLIEHARTATNEQIEFGQVQLGDLKGVMQAFMGEMSTRVNELSNEMNASLERNVGNAAQMANNVAVQAEEWTKQNGIQVSQMLAAQEAQLAQINQMRETLAITTTQLTQSMQGISHIATTTQLSVEVINKTAAALEGAALSGQKTQTNLQRIADASAVQVAELRNANQQQVAVWQGINASMRQYEQTFGSVEGKASELLQEVTTSLENYQQVCAGGFAKLVSISDEHFSNAAQKLGASVGELDEHLQDLSEIFEKVNGAKTNGNRIRQ